MLIKDNKAYFLVLVCALIGLINCTNNNEEDLYDGNLCDVSEVSFSDDIMPIVSATCAVVGCHVQGGGAPGIFENYDQVKAIVDDGGFNLRVIVQRDMPPSGPLSDCQILHIQEWINIGAPNN